MNLNGLREDLCLCPLVVDDIHKAIRFDLNARSLNQPQNLTMCEIINRLFQRPRNQERRQTESNEQQSIAWIFSRSQIDDISSQTGNSVMGPVYAPALPPVRDRRACS